MDTRAATVATDRLAEMIGLLIVPAAKEVQTAIDKIQPLEDTSVVNQAVQTCYRLWTSPDEVSSRLHHPFLGHGIPNIYLCSLCHYITVMS